MARRVRPAPAAARCGPVVVGPHATARGAGRTRRAGRASSGVRRTVPRNVLLVFSASALGRVSDAMGAVSPSRERSVLPRRVATPTAPRRPVLGPTGLAVVQAALGGHQGTAPEGRLPLPGRDTT